MASEVRGLHCVSVEWGSDRRTWPGRTTLKLEGMASCDDLWTAQGFKEISPAKWPAAQDTVLCITPSNEQGPPDAVSLGDGDQAMSQCQVDAFGSNLCHPKPLAPVNIAWLALGRAKHHQPHSGFAMQSKLIHRSISGCLYRRAACPNILWGRRFSVDSSQGVFCLWIAASVLT